RRRQTAATFFRAGRPRWRLPRRWPPGAESDSDGESCRVLLRRANPYLHCADLGEMAHHFDLEAPGQLYSLADGQARIDRDVCLGMQAMPDPSRTHLRHVADSSHLPARAPYLIDQAGLAPSSIRVKTAIAESPPIPRIKAVIASPMTGSAM